MAADRMCDKFDFLDCPDVFSGNRSGGASVPGQGASLSTVPASIANIDRTGVEIIKYDSSFDINLVAGTGVVGSGFSTTNNEGTFFGNIPIESDREFWNRKTNTDKYKSQKINGVLAFNLLGKKNKIYSASLGLVGKYNGETSKIGGGAGLTLRFGVLSASYTRTRDDGVDGDGLVSTYYTDSLSAGFKIANVAVDYTLLKNSTDYQTTARIFSISIFLKRVMLTYGQRSEDHGHPVVLTSDPLLVDSTDRKDHYGFLGVQVMFKKRFIFGVYNNYYLNNDFSAAFSAFF
ncbi:MAG: hypothetical protein ACJAT2_002241 [Bacteriovoracaceae bacterium]|jgi:hypothetical protein